MKNAIRKTASVALTPDSSKPLRCAVYARVSVEKAAQNEPFTSIHAQVLACKSFIADQRMPHWIAIEPSYEDSGYSGGNLNRPALQALISDMAAKKIDVVVIHKLDRLSRSMVDMVNVLIPLFDLARPQIRLVCLSPPIDTATPAGRLQLHVLTSFAQFERELTGERTRDKLAATRARGMWQGSATPLGFGVDFEQRLHIVPSEADYVVSIFKRFVSMGSVTALLEKLAHEKVKTKTWLTRNGKKRGGLPIDRNALNRILNNRMYIGYLFYNGAWHRNNHLSPIVDLELWNQVHALMDQRARRTGVQNTAKSEDEFFLMGRLFWQDGRPYKTLVSSKQKNTKDGNYRYYVVRKNAGEKGTPSEPANIRADEMHLNVIGYLRSQFQAPQQWIANLPQELKSGTGFSEGVAVAALASLDRAWGLFFPTIRASILRRLVSRITIFSNKQMLVKIDPEGLAGVIQEFAL